MELIISMTYGQALFDAALELNKIDVIKEETARVDEIFQREQQYLELLCNPAISHIRKRTMVRNVFEGRICGEVLSLLYILVDKNRMIYYSKIIREFNRHVDEYEGVGEGTLYSAEPLDEEQMKIFEEEAGKLLSEKVKLVNEIDKSLIGGIKLFVDGKYVDASLKGRLEKLQHKLKQD